VVCWPTGSARTQLDMSDGLRPTLSNLLQMGIGWLFARTTEVSVASSLYDVKNTQRVDEPKSIFGLLNVQA
jgi:hypothetical protein